MERSDETATASLLALCARIDGYPALPGRLARAATAIDWEALPARAEAHGLAPLAQAHLHAAEIEVPSQARDGLRARVLQHAHASRVRTGTLGEIAGVSRRVEGVSISVEVHRGLDL